MEEISKSNNLDFHRKVLKTQSKILSKFYKKYALHDKKWVKLKKDSELVETAIFFHI